MRIASGKDTVVRAVKITADGRRVDLGVKAFQSDNPLTQFIYDHFGYGAVARLRRITRGK